MQVRVHAVTLKSNIHAIYLTIPGIDRLNGHLTCNRPPRMSAESGIFSNAYYLNVVSL